MPLYSNEAKAQFMRLRYSAFQTVLHTTGPTQFDICSGFGTAATVYARLGQPVTLSNINPTTGAATVTADGSLAFSTACSAGAQGVSLSTAGNWYLLVEAPGTLSAGEIFLITASASGMAARPTSSVPATCVPPTTRVVISPQAPTVAPGAHLTLTASGGTQTGLSWSLLTNNSGASINAASGEYTAGASEGAVDTVKVIDSMGNSATAAVTVGQPLAISPSAATPAPGQTVAFTVSGGSGAGYAWALSANASGATLNSTTGLYKAGPKGGVSDTVGVVDSLGNSASATVTLRAATVKLSRAQPELGVPVGCSAGGPEGSALLLLLAVARLARGPSRRKPSPLIR